MTTISHFVAGVERSDESARRSPVYNPATGVAITEVELASTDFVNEAIGVARDALAGWRSTPLAKRAEILFAIRAILDDKRLELATIISREHGKVVSDALGEVARGIENIDFACGIPNLIKGGYSEQVARGVDVHSVLQPVGVVAAITPFNFPAMVPMWMLGNAIATGNTVVLKPSEKDPSAAIAIARWCKEAGLPDGVLNVVNGDVESVDALLAHPDVAAVSFVGSTPVARSIYAKGTAAGKRVQALGGAKNHMVVLPDADLGMAADAAVSAAYGSAGERCMAISVVVAVGEVADPLVEAIAERVDKLVIGPGDDERSEMGPLITREHRDKVASYIGDAVTDGATVVRDGRDADLPTDGFFLGVSLIDHVTTEMSVYTDEIFGPVLCVIRVDTYDEAVSLINTNRYGNGCAIYTRDGGAARQFEFEVECGMVGINVPIPVPVAWFSFGGWNESLFGDSHMYGPEGIHFFTRTKVVTTRWPDPASSTVNLGFPQLS